MKLCFHFWFSCYLFGLLESLIHFCTFSFAHSILHPYCTSNDGHLTNLNAIECIPLQFDYILIALNS